LEETKELGKRLGALLEVGDMVCMNGDLGAGKTFFTKAMALGMGVTDDVTSPTYTIINEYDGPPKVYHFDVYRIMDIEEMYDIGYEEYFFGQGICLVEWADGVRELIPDNHLWIEITRLDENSRRFSFSASGKRHEEILKELFA
jgi:tRNA threonylcarbamoyladenosine biosynthesis protein TsaE